MERSTASVDWEQKFDRVAAPDGRGWNREKLRLNMLGSVLTVFVFACVILLHTISLILKTAVDLQSSE